MKLFLAVFFLFGTIVAVYGTDSSNLVKSENGEEILGRVRRYPACDRDRALFDNAPSEQRASRLKKLNRCLTVLAYKCAKWETLLAGKTLKKKRRAILERKLTRRCNGTIPDTGTPESCIYYSSGPVDTELLNNYNGTKNVTRKGRTCQNWSLTGIYAFVGQHSYCRNPNMAIGPWCYTTDTGDEWDFCFDACDIEAHGCVDEAESCAYAGSLACKLDGYSGTRNTTKYDQTCGPWQAKWQSRYGSDNYCRNPDGNQVPWCYTANSWDDCFYDCNNP